MKAPADMSLAERLRLKTLVTPNCWEWQAAKNAYGYGILRFQYRHMMAHRASYEVHVGPIPAGLVLDHICRNVGCVRPDHLRPVTDSFNTRVGRMGFDYNGLCRADLHDITAEGSVEVSKNGSRRCIECFKIWKEKDKQRRAEGRAQKVPSETCARGHAMDGRRITKGKVTRFCKTCSLQRERERTARKKGDDAKGK